MATASWQRYTPKNPFFPQNKHSKFIIFFCKNLTKQNFSYSCSHISNSQSKLTNWVRLHGKFNYGCTICLHHALGTQKESICAICSKHKKPFWQDHPSAEPTVWTLPCWKHHPFTPQSSNSTLNKHRSHTALPQEQVH